MRGAPEHPDPDDIRTLEDLRAALRVLWGGVPYGFHEEQGLRKTTVGGILGGSRPTCPARETLVTFLRVCGVRPPETARWLAARDRVIRATPLPLVRDANALALGVRQSIRTPGSPLRPGELPEYVPREHDRELRELVSANDGRPRLVLLVGGAATGKTRSAYEALERVPDWGLLAPAPEDAHNAVDVEAESVVWLDEAQRYLADTDAAAALHTLMTSREGNILVIGTLWPRQWDRLRGRPADGHADPYLNARRLLGLAVRVDVPDTFDEVELAKARQVARTDPRIRAAYEACRDRWTITQVLAGGPEVIEHYKDAEPLPKAVMDAAIDARRLGLDGPLRANLLRRAALGYLSAEQRAAVEAKPDRRFKKAVKYCREERGGLAALTLVSADADGAFELDGFLADREGDRRRGRLVPAETWDAFVAVVDDGRERRVLAREAARRGLYRHACRLAWPLTAEGDPASMCLLAEQYARLARVADADEWWRRAAESGSSYGAVRWAHRLEENGDTEAAERHWRKAAGAGDAYALWHLADRLQRTGRVGEAESLWERAVRRGDPFVIERYADWLRGQGRAEAAEQLWREVSRTGRVLSAQWLISTLALTGLLDDTDRTEEARRELDRAADKGHPAAMRRLAAMLDTDGDHDGARRWLVRAADHGDVVAIRELARRDGDDDRPEEAERWFLRAATAGDTFSMWQLAEQLDRDGRGDEAERWLRRAGERGDTYALTGLAERMERAGRPAEAERLWRDAGGSGHPPALEHLAGFLTRHGREPEAQRLRGYGIEPDGRTALPWEPGAG